MDETLIDWTVPNWITIVIMAILGFAVIGLVGRVAAKVKAGGDNA